MNNFISLTYLYRKHSIEFELNNFNKDYNQNKETTTTFCSPQQKFGAYTWSVGAKVRKHPTLKNEFFLAPFLQCESAVQSKFLVHAYVKFCILNQEKDSRKTHSKGMIYI